MRFCAELRPDAVFLDINLPGRDGVSLATQLAMLPQPPSPFHPCQRTWRARCKSEIHLMKRMLTHATTEEKEAMNTLTRQTTWR